MNKTNKCCRCKRFDRYYTMDTKRFNKTTLGWCCDKQDIVSAQNGCDNYVQKPYTRNVRSCIKVCLNNLLNEISAIRNIVEEDLHENEDM